MKKKAIIIISVLALILSSFVVFLMVYNTPERYFKGEVIKIEELDEHLVFTVKENEEKQHIVHATYIDFVKYANSDENDYAHNIEVGDYIEGFYHNKFPYKKEFAKEICLIEK